MPIFSGTDVQRILEDNARVLTPARSRDHLGRLTSGREEHVLGAEWEIVLMHSLNRSGRVEDVAARLPEPLNESGKAHSEAKLPGSVPPRQPDLLFHPDLTKFPAGAATAMSVTMLVEISAVSDQDAEKNNPQRFLYEAFRRLIKQHRLSTANFRLDMKGHMERKPAQERKPGAAFDPVAWLRPNLNHGKMRLAAPPAGEINSFVKTHLGPWVARVALDPKNLGKFAFAQEGVWLEASYHPRGEYLSTGGYPSYTATYSIEDNPVAQRLRKKREQISKSAHRGVVAGIILCDGGCDLLADRGGYGGPESFTLGQVVTHFLNRQGHEVVSFVVTLAPVVLIDGWGRCEGPFIQAQAFCNPGSRHPVGETALNSFVRHDLLENLPGPVNTATNAQHLIAGRGGFAEGAPPTGGFCLPL